jgi:hypothetical protein
MRLLLDSNLNCLPGCPDMKRASTDGPRTSILSL